MAPHVNKVCVYESRPSGCRRSDCRFLHSARSATESRRRRESGDSNGSGRLASRQADRKRTAENADHLGRDRNVRSRTASGGSSSSSRGGGRDCFRGGGTDTHHARRIPILISESPDNITQAIDIPSSVCGIIIGVKGRNIIDLTENYPDAAVRVETAWDGKEGGGSQRAFITAPRNTVRNILIEIKERFETRNIHPIFLRQYLAQYCIPFEEQQTTDSGGSGDRRLLPTPPLSNSSAGGSPPLNCVSLQQQLHSNSGIEQQQRLPTLSGLLPQTQHRLRVDLGDQPVHPCSLVGLLADDLVTFQEMCSCYAGCPFANFRSGLDLSGVVHVGSVQEEVVPFFCPYCHHFTEFYYESEYLDHLCRQHFWRQLMAHLPPPLPPRPVVHELVAACPTPARCPMPGCLFTAVDYDKLLLHFGGIPHRKVNLLVVSSVSQLAMKKEQELQEQLHLRQQLHSLEASCSRLQMEVRQKGERIQEFKTWGQQCKVEKMAALARLEQQGAVVRSNQATGELQRRVSELERQVLDLETKNRELVRITDEARGQLSDERRAEDQIRRLEAMLAAQKAEADQEKAELEKEKRELEGRIVANLSKIQTLEMKAYTMEEQYKEELSMARCNSASSVDMAAKDQRIAQLEAELAATRQSGSNAESCDGSATVGRLQNTVKRLREMLKLKEQEIDLLREQEKEGDLFTDDNNSGSDRDRSDNVQ